jgi:hypothetical protein
MKLLQDYLETVVNGATPGGPGLGDSLAGLDSLATDKEKVPDPKLRHYLERRSYGKAYEYIRSGVAEHGSCGKG